MVVVLTLFNVSVKYRYYNLYKEVASNDYLYLNADYLRRRFELFEKYTFSSFASQTSSDFRWIVMFHKDTPKEFIECIEKYKKLLPQFEPWFIGEDERYNDVIKKDFADKYASSRGVISVRVDNDDAVHCTFIDAISTKLRDCTKTTILSFSNGLQYDDRTGRIMRYNYENNHFIALFDKRDDLGVIRNVHSFCHTDADSIVDSDHKIVCRTRIPMWVEIVSETNCVNEMWTRPSKLFVPFTIAEQFPVLNVRWRTKGQWIMYIVRLLTCSLVMMVVDVVRILYHNKKNS